MIHSRQSIQNGIVRFDPWTLDVELGLLRDGEGAELRLEPRLSKLMSVLMTHSGSFVSRRDLIDAVWPDSVVTEQSLTRAVSDLRKLLRANLAAPPAIETASKQGYRLTSPSKNKKMQRPAYWKALKRVAYGLGALVLLVLVLRGLNY